MKPTPESENLAERLRSLYKLYDCEQELPKHEDLVAKLGKMDHTAPGKRYDLEGVLDQGLVYPLSYEEALQIENSSPFYQRFMGFLLPVLFVGPIVIPAAVKVFFLTTKEERVKELLESNNKLAKQYFEIFKAQVEYKLNAKDKT